MNDLIINAVISAGGLVLLGLLALGRRRTLLWFGILFFVAIALSVRGAIMPRTWPTLAGDVGLSRPLFLLLLWMAYGALFRALPDHGLRGHPALLAAALAAMVGELVAAAMVQPLGSTPRGRARLALCAAAGGMASRLGDPALLVLGGRTGQNQLMLLPLALGCLVLAWPAQSDLAPTPPRESAIRTGPLVVIGAATLWSTLWGLTFSGLVIAILLLSYWVRHHFRSLDLGTAGLLAGPALVILAVASGGVDMIAQGVPDQNVLGLEAIALKLGDLWLPVATLVGGTSSALLGGTTASLLFAGLLDRAPGIDDGSLLFALTAGLAVGGLGPLVAARALRAGLGTWLAQVGLTLGYVLILS